MRGSVAYALAVAGIVVAGCAFNSPQETFYTLDAASAATATAPSGAAASTLVVFVAPARVPELVERPQMVISIGAAQVVPLEQQRWAEPLRAQIARVVALDLAQVLQSSRVSTNEDVLDGADPSKGYRVTLDVQRFETRPGEAAAMEVAWTVRRAPSGVGGGGGVSGVASPSVVAVTDVVASGRERVREPATEPGYDGVVRAHNRALASVGRTIAAALRAAAGTGN